MNETQVNIMRHVGHLDGISLSYEARWGIGRLVEIAEGGLREKWERQWKKLDEAIQKQDIRLVEDLCQGCIRGWGALEQHALTNGHKPIDVVAWEVRHPESGKVYRIVKNNMEAEVPAKPGVLTYTLEEVARLLEGAQLVNVIKENFPGAEVKNVTAPIDWEKGDEIPL